MPTTKQTKTQSGDSKAKAFKGFSDHEREAMRERAQELIMDKGDGEAALLAKVAAMSPSDRAMAEHIHQLVTQNAPTLSPKTWYGMPAYANKDGKVVCFFQGADKFKARYATLGFNDAAKLDEGNFWATSFALKKITAAEEAKIIQLLKKAVG